MMTVPRGLPPGRTALLIDDDEDFREVVRQLLTRAGCGLREATSGAAGLAEFGRQRPDLVICDVNLPDMLGWEVCRRIRAVDRSTPVLLCSVRSGASSLADSLAAGANGYIVKPFENAEFLKSVSLALRL